MTRVLQPQRDIDREKGREREREREREKEGEREREQGLLLLVLRHYIARLQAGETSSIKTIYYKYKTLVCILSFVLFFTRRRFCTEAVTHRRIYTQTLLHTEAFTHRRFYTQKLLHTEGFSHRHQTFLHTQAFTHRRLYTQTLGTFTQRRLLHTGAFTHTQTLLYPDACTHTHTFTHKRFCTQKLLYTEAFTQLLHTEAFTHRHFYTQTFLPTEAFTHTQTHRSSTTAESITSTAHIVLVCYIITTNLFTPCERFEPRNVQLACSKEVNLYEFAQSTAKYQIFNFETENTTPEFDIAKHHCRDDLQARDSALL